MKNKIIERYIGIIDRDYCPKGESIESQGEAYIDYLRNWGAAIDYDVEILDFQVKPVIDDEDSFELDMTIRGERDQIDCFVDDEKLTPITHCIL